MEAGKNSVIYMGLILGPNKADDTCGATTVMGTMDRGFTVIVSLCDLKSTSRGPSVLKNTTNITLPAYACDLGISSFGVKWSVSITCLLVFP
jgi:hypothetical protein